MQHLQQLNHHISNQAANPTKASAPSNDFGSICWNVCIQLPCAPWPDVIHFVHLEFETRERKQWSGSPSEHHRPRFLRQIRPIKTTYPYPLRFHKVARLCFGSVLFNSAPLQGKAPLNCSVYSTGLRFHAQAGTVCTKTAASDLETTAYFLGQLRDYVHLKSSEEGSRGEVEPRSCLFFVPIGPT